MFHNSLRYITANDYFGVKKPGKPGERNIFRMKMWSESTLVTVAGAVMNVDELKRQLQNISCDGLVTIIGSGLSCAEGLPSMHDLATQLTTDIPLICSGTDLLAWEQIRELLQAGYGLEQAINEADPPHSLESAIIQSVSRFVLTQEQQAICECFENKRTLKISRFLAHFNDTARVHIVTTNYDRLIEFAGELEGYWIENCFCGKFAGKFAPDISRVQGAIGIETNGKRAKLKYQKRLNIFKPHGSLDWVLYNGSPIHSQLVTRLSPLIITPGKTKYLRGYEQPFDRQREEGNRQIDRASALLFVGYGFNDDHLQTHILSRINSGTQGVILAKSLTDATKNIISGSPSLIALSEGSTSNTLVTTSTNEWEIDIPFLWDIENFTKEVLE
ncbi:SIR2 family protein [Desulfovibrio sp. OttesenSCG-928-F20]|nr:SIR2 family protein [Desulfovibrio sp. OttesenSCG-928-F20]